MTIIERIAAIAGLCAAVTACTQANPPPGQSAAPDALFGIRLGVAIEKQFEECPKNEAGDYKFGFHNGAAPCWKTLKDGKEVALPSNIANETGAHIDSVARIKIYQGLVVEIDVEANRFAWREAEAYMLRHYGTPAETETYEMDSRVGGRSQHRAHTWRGNGVSLYFTERISNEKARMRAVNNAWDRLDAAERKKLNSTQ